MTARAAALACLAGLALSAPASAAGTIRLLVLKEQGVGSAAHAQPYVDRLTAIAAEQNGWPSAAGKYLTSREAAAPWIASEKPQFGILSLGAFLALRAPLGLSVIGKAEVAGSGGRAYHVVSTAASDLAGCKGKGLASNHAGDARFVDRVVAGGAFTLADFQLVTTRRPMETIKAVTRGEAVCALIDDAQHEAMKSVEGGEKLRSVWKSEALPPMVVVAFAGAPASETKQFRGNLSKVCAGDGEPVCAEVGLRSLSAAGEADYRAVIQRYGE